MKSLNSIRRTLITALSLSFILLGRFVPAPAGLGQPAMQVLGIFVGVLILWMTISIDWPSLLCVLAISTVPGMNLSSILSGSFGNSTFAFLLFTFLCTYTLSRTDFIRRCALWFVSLPFARKGYWQFMTLYFAAVLFLGSFMSPTVLVVVLLPITEEIFSVLRLQKGSKTAALMMMGLVFCSGISAGMTLIAHVFPIMALNFYTTSTGNVINAMQYMTAAIPVGLLTVPGMVLLFRFVLRPDEGELKTLDVTGLKSQLQAPDRREKRVVSVFFGVVALWVLPSVLKPIAPGFYKAMNGFGTAWPPLFGAVLLALLSENGHPLLDFKEAMSRGVPWASLVMVVGTLTLGSALTNSDIGLTVWISEAMTPFVHRLSPLAVVFLFALWTALQTNLSSNMVTVTVVSAIAVPVASGLGTVSPAALIVLIGILSAYAFATPPAMPTVVFAIGSGWTDTKQMAIYGFLLMIIAVVIAVLVGYPLAVL